MIFKNILQAVGNTPVIKINNLCDKNSAEILVKLESLNVGGSIKTRTALNMILNAEKKALISPDKTVIVEPSSGNQGIGLALVGAVKGYKVVIIMPDSVSEERQKLIKFYGAKVILVKDNGNMGECMKQCLKLAFDAKKSNPNVFLPQQFKNEFNLKTHELFTAKEILKQVGKRIDGFCSGIGTGGTISGVGKALKERNANTVIWAVEPENSAILSGGKIGTHLQMGIGDGIIPPILDRNIYDKIIRVSDKDALETAKKLALYEGIACGISSGSNFFATVQLAKLLGKGKTVLTILPDNCERYFSTPLFA